MVLDFCVDYFQLYFSLSFALFLCAQLGGPVFILSLFFLPLAAEVV